MRRARAFLSLALVVVWLGSSAGLAAPPRAAGDLVAQAVGPGQTPTGLTPSEWQGIQAQVAKLVADDGAAYDHFGDWSTRVDGDTAVVGSEDADVGGNAGQGAAYIFYRDQGGPDAWGQVAKLTASDGAADDRFAVSVSVSGDTVVVGADHAQIGGNPIQGAAYVFYRDQGGADAWGQVAKLTAADGAAVDLFGWAVSLSGDTAVVGAPFAYVGGNSLQGAAYIFYRDQGGPDAWGQVAKLTAADGAYDDRFGGSASVDGDTAVVGAGCATVGGNYRQGAAYVFYRDQGGADAWGQVAKLIDPGGTAEDYFGSHASVDGDTAAVGANQADVGGNYNQGAAYIFYRDQGGDDAWGQVAKLTASDAAAEDWFGSVSVDGDAAVVGASAGGDADQGAAYVFSRHQGGPDAWGQVDKLTAADGAWADSFGCSVSLSGQTVQVGAASADVGGNVDQGAAYVFHPNTPPVAADDAFTAPEDTPLVVAAPGVLLNDTDVDGDLLTAVLDTDTVHGTLYLHADGSFTYSPAADWSGVDTFTYHANDGQADSNVATVTLTVSPVNDAPMAVDDLYSTPLGVPLAVAAPGVLLNDTDVEGDPLTAVLDTGPAHGTLDLHADGSFTYTPAACFGGVDTFTYHANDGHVDSNVATVDITVTGQCIFLPLVVRNY